MPVLLVGAGLVLGWVVVRLVVQDIIARPLQGRVEPVGLRADVLEDVVELNPCGLDTETAPVRYRRVASLLEELIDSAPRPLSYRQAEIEVLSALQQIECDVLPLEARRLARRLVRRSQLRRRRP